MRLKIGNLLFANLHKDLKRYESFSNVQSSKRLALGDGVPIPDVYSHLLDANKTSTKQGSPPLFTPNDLVGESSLLITGGKLSLHASHFYSPTNA